ncbi:MAG: hypothetical protein IIT57_12445 [Treponema sp.]|nr:hypothetical protein [Treponema sp.]
MKITSKFFTKLAASLLIGTAGIMFMSCGSKISGTYSMEVLGIKSSFSFKGGNKVVLNSSAFGKMNGTYEFNKEENTISVKLENGETHEFVYDSKNKTIQEDMLVYTKN